MGVNVDVVEQSGSQKSGYNSGSGTRRFGGGLKGQEKDLTLRFTPGSTSDPVLNITADRELDDDAQSMKIYDDYRRRDFV